MMAPHNPQEVQSHRAHLSPLDQPHKIQAVIPTGRRLRRSPTHLVANQHVHQELESMEDRTLAVRLHKMPATQFTCHMNLIASASTSAIMA